MGRWAVVFLVAIAGVSGCGGEDGDESGDAPDQVTLTVTRPEDGARTERPRIKVAGTATGAAAVTVNGKSATLRPSGAARSFEVPVRLRVGENEIVIEASGDGQRTRQTIIVIRKRGRGGRDDSGGDSGGSAGGAPETAPPNQGAPPAAPVPPNQGAPPSPSAPPPQGAPPAEPGPPQGGPPGGGPGPPNQGAPPAPGDGG